MKSIEKIIGLVLVLLLIALVARRYLPMPTFLNPREPLPAALRPLANSLKEAMPYNTQKEDAAALCSLMSATATLIENDGRSDLYAVGDRATLKDRLVQMGDLVVGPDWTIGERYPSLPGIISSHLDPIQEFPAGRQDAVAKLNEISACFADISCQ